MITAWRIVDAAYAEQAFDGEGSRLWGGRWNSRGVKIVHVSSSAALAALELLVRIKNRQPFHRYLLFACSFDARLVEIIERSALPADWRAYPPPPGLQSIGDTWVRQARTAILQVPSAVIETEPNYLLNPEHRDFKTITIADPTPFSLDLRLLRR